MKYTLAVLICVFSVTANAQTAMPKGELPVVPPSVTPQQEIITFPAVIPERPTPNSAPCQNCNNNNPYTGWLFGRFVTNWENSPGHRYDTDTLTFWFIPRPRALIAALWP